MQFELFDTVNQGDMFENEILGILCFTHCIIGFCKEHWDRLKAINLPELVLGLETLDIAALTKISSLYQK